MALIPKLAQSSEYTNFQEVVENQLHKLGSTLQTPSGRSNLTICSAAESTHYVAFIEPGAVKMQWMKGKVADGVSNAIGDKVMCQGCETGDANPRKGVVVVFKAAGDAAAKGRLDALVKTFPSTLSSLKVSQYNAKTIWKMVGPRVILNKLEDVHKLLFPVGGSSGNAIMIDLEEVKTFTPGAHTKADTLDEKPSNSAGGNQSNQALAGTAGGTVTAGGSASLKALKLLTKGRLVTMAEEKLKEGSDKSVLAAADLLTTASKLQSKSGAEFMPLPDFAPLVIAAAFQDSAPADFKPTQVGGGLAYLGQMAPIKNMPGVANVINASRFQGEPNYAEEPECMANHPMYQILFRRVGNKLEFTEPGDFRNSTSGFALLVQFFGTNASGTLSTKSYKNGAYADTNLGYFASRPVGELGDVFNSVVQSWETIFLDAGSRADDCPEFVALQKCLQKSLDNLRTQDQVRDVFNPGSQAGTDMCKAIQQAILDLDDALFDIFRAKVFTKTFTDDHSNLKLGSGVPKLCTAYATNILYGEKNKDKEGSYLLWEGKVCDAMVALWESGVNPWKPLGKGDRGEERHGRRFGQRGGRKSQNQSPQNKKIWTYSAADLAGIKSLAWPGDYQENPQENGMFKVKDNVRSQLVQSRKWDPILVELKKLKSSKPVDKF